MAYIPMKLNLSAQELALILVKRSPCRIKMAAVLHDRKGIFSYGWNSSGYDGMGQHAEEHAIGRANKNRLKGATVTIAGRGRKPVCSFPCADRCLSLILKKGIKRIVWQDADGDWNVSPGV